MSRIDIFNYNNYYNRLFKREANLDAYIAAGTNHFAFSKINFFKNDGVMTTQTLNFAVGQTMPDPDYLIVSDENKNIKSRWFVVESHWNRDLQLSLRLVRDVLVDFYDDYKNEDFYCEKGPIPTGYSDLIYNDEGMTFNQILKSRTLLRPTSGATSRYIVGYIDKTWAGGKVYYAEANHIYDTWDECPLNIFKNGNGVLADPTEAVCRIKLSDQAKFSGWPDIGSGFTGTIRITPSGARSMGAITANSDTLNCFGAENLTSTHADVAVSSAKTNCSNFYHKVWKDLRDNLGFRDFSEFNAYDGTKILVNGIMYEVSITSDGAQYAWTPSSLTNEESDIAYYIMNALDLVNEQPYLDLSAFGGTASHNPNIDFALNYNAYTVTFTEVTDGSGVTVVTIPASRTTNNILPYDIMYAVENSETRNFFTYLASQYMGGHVIYDLQVLPFSPASSAGESSMSVGSNTVYFTKNDSIHGTFFHDAIATYSTNQQKKRGAVQDLCRLYGPSGATCWEFNPAKIGGVPANSIKYEVTFAPYSPYIHVFPTFGAIYGSVNRDYSAPLLGESRGLVCSGDFSIPYSTNNWATYKINNSAFQLAHDRQIRNMAVNFTAERINEAVGAVGGVLSGTIQGGMLGPAGAVAGALGAGITGGAQIAMNDILRKEEMSFAEDMFGYQLRNVQAQAQPLAHTNFLSIGVSYFPYIEYYSSTDVEKTILTDRLMINGCSLGVVVTVAQMLSAAGASGTMSKFFKGRLVKFAGSEDTHIVSAINAELAKGVRIQ